MKSPKSKMPSKYYQEAREEKRKQDIVFATSLFSVSRHTEDPEGSQRWVETGCWEERK